MDERVDIETGAAAMQRCVVGRERRVCLCVDSACDLGQHEEMHAFDDAGSGVLGVLKHEVDSGGV